MPASRMRQVSDAPSSYFDVCAATAAVYPTPRRLLLPGCFAGLLAAPYAGVSRIVGHQAEALLALRVAPAPLLPQSSFTHEMVVVRASKPLASAAPACNCPGASRRVAPEVRLVRQNEPRAARSAAQVRRPAPQPPARCWLPRRGRNAAISCVNLPPAAIPPTPWLQPRAVNLVGPASARARASPQAKVRVRIATSPAARIAATGAGRPVISTTWAAAWPTSTASPPTTGTRARRAADASAVGHGAYSTSTSAARPGQPVMANSSVAPAGVVATTTAASATAAGACAHGRNRTCRPTPAPSSTRAPPAAGRRSTTSTSRAPLRANATSTARAVPPPPSTTAPAPGTGRPNSANAVASPVTSVLSPDSQPPRGSTVFAAPTVPATSDSPSSSGSTAVLSGIVNDSPAHSGSARTSASKPGRPTASHFTASYRQSARPSAAYAARCSTGESECAIGDPSTAAQRRPFISRRWPGWSPCPCRTAPAWWRTPRARTCRW